ncbi:MAG: PadR family transcriptional regulator [Bacteroidota bacterium]
MLRLLEEHGQMYGYQITQLVRKQSNEQLLLTEGALYPTLHKLEADGLIKSKIEKVGNRPRKYYRLTPAGQKAAQSKAAEFQAFVQIMQLILKPSKS